MQRNATKGIKTRFKIYEVAKKLFYEKGFNDVTMIEIAKSSEVATGNLTYYFANKNEIATIILRDFLNEIMDFVKKSYPNMTSVFERHFYHMMIFNTIVFSNENYKKFYYEILTHNTMSGIYSELVEHIYMGLIEEFSIRVTQIQYLFIKIADSGARKESFLTYYENKIKIPPKDYALMVYENTCRLTGVPANVFPKAAYTAYRNMDKLDYSHIKFL